MKEESRDAVKELARCMLKIWVLVGLYFPAVWLPRVPLPEMLQ
jgi:hypothetical protein